MICHVGYKVKIPAIFINHADGQQLRELLEDHPDSSVMMKVVFENRKTEKVDVKFWLQASTFEKIQIIVPVTGWLRTSVSSTLSYKNSLIFNWYTHPFPATNVALRIATLARRTVPLISSTKMRQQEDSFSTSRSESR